MRNGFSHVGVSTHDMATTIAFHSGVLDFPCVADELIRLEDGGQLRQVFFDVGAGQYLVFMELSKVPGVRPDYDTGINGALGVPGGMYHYALRASTLNELCARRDRLVCVGVEVSSIIDLGSAKSIFFSDPNGIQFEFTCQTRPFDASDLGRESAASLAPVARTVPVPVR